MAFAFTLKSKRRIKNEDPETMTGHRWKLVYAFTCLAGDTSGNKDISADLGGSLTISNLQASLNASDDVFVSSSGTTVTVGKDGAAGTAGYLEVEANST